MPENILEKIIKKKIKKINNLKQTIKLSYLLEKINEGNLFISFKDGPIVEEM